MMSLAQLFPNPIAATEHRGRTHNRGLSAVTMLTIYLVLLIAIPSNVVISALGAYGRPQFLWGVVLFLWWTFSRLQARQRAVEPVPQPVRVALGAFVVIVLVGFAVALFRGQPADQISPAISALLRLVSWSGVVLVALDGIRTMADLFTIIKTIVVAGTLLAMLGLAQFVTGMTFVDVIAGLPGLSASDGGVDTRGMFLRSSGTGTHPLEYGMALAVSIPLAMAVAIRSGSHRLRWWICVGILSLASLLAVSRSALIGFVVAVILMIPALPRKYRAGIIVAGVILAAVVAIATPGLYGTVVGMFLGVGTDPSSQSRQAGIALAPILLSAVPWLGAGIGTLLPRYFIFDNQWLVILIETGILGTLAFTALFISAIWSAVRAGRTSRGDDIQVFGRALGASTATAGLLLAFFDAFAFPIAAGLLFMLFGLCGAARAVGLAGAVAVPD